MSTEMVIADKPANLLDMRAAVAPRSLADVKTMAETVSRAGLYGVKSSEEALIRMVTGMELGLSMMQSLRGVFVMTNGGKSQPGLYADMMVGIVKSRNDVCEYFRLVESSGTRATYETKRKGEPQPVSLSFTIEQARAAGLSSDPWRKYPDAMLRARASTALARAVYADVLNGLYSVEEIQDMGGTASPDTRPFSEQLGAAPPQLEQQLQASVDLNERRARTASDLRDVFNVVDSEARLAGAKELMQKAIADKLLSRSVIDELIAIGTAKKAEIEESATRRRAANEMREMDQRVDDAIA